MLRNEGGNWTKAQTKPRDHPETDNSGVAPRVPFGGGCGHGHAVSPKGIIDFAKEKHSKLQR